jgi:murein hydrolase activator
MRIVFFCFWCCWGLASPLDAAQSDKLREKSRDLNLLEKQLQESRRSLRQQQKQEGSLLNEMNILNRNLTRVRRELQTHEKNLLIVQNKLKEIESVVDFSEKEIDSHKNALKAQLVYQYKAGPLKPLEVIFSSGGMGELLIRYRFFKELAKLRRERIEAAVLKIEEVAVYRQQYEEKREELFNRKNSVAQSRSQVEEERKRKNTLLAQVRRQRDQTTRMIRELEESASKLQDLVARLRQEEARRLSQTTVSPSKAGATNLPGTKRVPWPVNGRVISRFGKEIHPQFNTEVFNRGIQIAAPLGSVVKSVADAVVLYADWFTGYGQMVILDHGGGYYTVYGNLSELGVNQGVRIGALQTVGKVGDSGVSKQAALYFEIRKNGRAENPLLWLTAR